ncbi:Neuropeptide-Like Protein [Caenorhabditis elegans]|uniref:Neuropeptide-Like Protein n=1 Tax=Caenorhabditis elegans TaxID=6239 RepID=O76722_CAEEL|nr:Neuropeptide-Like Protein [Caenorhabditis elegans]CCD70659.1 Neuropeptide-Like Protein [Caenorhabditis elegans]|eukprot:NP_500770.1 Neuropeptide-Like Protein [Caenorhabditis elegans]
MQLYVVLCFLVLLGLSAGQMTFTDQWTKKRATLHKQLPVVTPEEPICPSDRVQAVFEQLDQLQKAQQRLTEYLASCAYPVEVPQKAEKM